MFNFSKVEKITVIISCVFAIFLITIPNSHAMHIMEGYLPLQYCILWIAISTPFLIYGFIKIKKIINENPRTIILLAISGAFIFVISSLKIPSVTGSCSHMTGTGLAAILFGIGITSILGIIVLLFQAILLAHGGITTIGANTFSMAIAGPIITYFIYKLGSNIKVNKKIVIFISAMLGDLLTYCITSIQLAIAHPSDVGGIIISAQKFLIIFAPTQIPLAITEGILTVLIVIGLESFANPELKELGFEKQE